MTLVPLGENICTGYENPFPFIWVNKTGACLLIHINFRLGVVLGFHPIPLLVIDYNSLFCYQQFLSGL